MKTLRTLISAAVITTLPLAANAQVPEALRAATQQAVASNPEVQARWHAFRAAGNDQDAARGGFLPRVDLVAGLGRERLKVPDEATRSFSRRGVALSLNQMVYDGFFTRSEVSRLGHATMTRYFELVDGAESVALEVVRAYADVLRYRELVQLAKDNYVEHKLIADQIGERTRAGIGRGVDLEQAAGRLALAESNLLTEVSNLHDVSARYLRIVGEQPAPDLPALQPDALAGGLPADIAAVLDAAFANSPALQAAVANMRAGEALIDARRAAFQPRVDLRARQALDRNLDGIDGRHREGVVELVMTYNLYRGGSDQARLRQAADERNLARDLREKACRDLRQTLSIAFNDVLRIDEQLRYLDQHQLSTGKAREAYRQQFDIGQRTLLDLLDTENEYFEARRAYVNAVYNRIIAQARSHAGIGQLLHVMGVAHENLTEVGEAAQAAYVETESICPAEAPDMLVIDKEALLAETLRAAGGARR